MSDTSETRRGISGTKVLTIAAIVLLGLIFISWAWRTAAAARADFEQQRNAEMASESRALCEKWGIAAGTPRFEECLADIQTVRDRQAERIANDEEPF